IHHDTSLYCSQTTNECGTATSHFDILYTCSDNDGGDLLSFIIEKHEENKSIWTKVATICPTNTT
ncbi:unnamed protein product, partial [Rotaria sp. Silwood2]